MDGRIDVSIVTNSDIRTASSSAHARASAGTNPRVTVCSDASPNGCIDVSTDLRIDRSLDASTDDRIDSSLHEPFALHCPAASPRADGGGAAFRRTFCY